ncbi:hypothetical protein GQ457_16G010140 [Hibiscus cannabinus]
MEIQVPNVMFLCETRTKNSRMEHVKRVLGVDGCFSVDTSHDCTGLALCWDNTVDVSLLSYSNIHIDATIRSTEGVFRFTGLHGYANSNNRVKTWQLLDRLKVQSDLPWLVGGDINKITQLNEKQGGKRRPNYLMQNFQDALVRNTLFDIKPSKGWFTWSKKGPPSSKVWARLDRYLATPIWLDAFPNHQVQSEYTAASDHFFLILDTTCVSLSTTPILHNDYYKFEACWASEQDCHTRVTSCWDADHQTTLEKLSSVGKSLHSWQQGKKYQSVRRINYLQKVVNALMANPFPSSDDLKTLADCEIELKNLLDKDEAYWSQRSRVHWLREGDRNTRFFHARATGRRKKNRIMGLNAPDGTWHDRLPGLHQIASDYFTSLFSSGECASADVILDCISPSITDDMNATLRAPFTSDEVQAALFQIHPTKAPGIDGRPSSFYRQFWDTIGTDVTQLCIDLLNGNIDMVDVNQTVIVLIPKIQAPTQMRQFRPISLCTVVYKTVSKVLVNRLRPLMSVCIDEEQAAFVPGRHISDNIIVAHELIHYLQSSRNGPNKGAALKLDIEKAYDRVEWSFLQEGLSALLHANQNKGRIRGIRASQNGPRVTHLLYADDSILFVKNSLREMQCVRDTLDIYAACSGQKINYDKSSIYFSPATPLTSRARFFDILPVKEVSEPNTYLGMPLIIGRNKLRAFGFLSDNVSSRVRSWNKNLLSFGGREVFLKAVAQALPTYVMSCYMIPDCIIDRIVRVMRNYWWSERTSGRGWPMIAWKKLCAPKRAGGLAFRDLHQFNIALLGKQIKCLQSKFPIMNVIILSTDITR